jgi:hypothetical protein
MCVIMTINYLQKISYINIFNVYDLRLLVMILLINTNYLLFMLIFTFSQSLESPQHHTGYSTN